MSKAKTPTIQLNGQVYDAVSGKILTFSKQASGKVVDGFVRAKSTTRLRSKAQKRTVQKSKTLMRPAVKKPTHKTVSDSAKNNLRDTANAAKARLERAKASAKSPAVSRFVHATHAQATKLDAIVAKPRGVLSGRAVQAQATAAKQAKTTIKDFERAIDESMSHLEKLPRKSRKFLTGHSTKRRRTNIISASLAAALLLGFFAYQNTPNIQMRLASTKAGFSANIPGYKPAGFGVDRHIQTEPGKVSVTFRSRTDKKDFKLTQQASDWSSQTLLSKQVANSNRSYQTYEDKGKTVYIFDSSNATWVDGGVLYKIEGSASLTSDQLLRIADSL